MKDESKFRAVPRLDTFKIPFKLEEKLLVNWLTDLNQSESKEACWQTLALLQALNKTEISFKNRLSFLNLINEYLKYYIKYLEGQCWDAGFPLSIEENVYAEIIVWNYLTLAQGFFMVAENASKKNDIVFALGRALESLGQAQLHIAATYSVPNDGFWSLNYQIFALAEKKNLLHLPIEGNDFKQLTINILFGRCLIFHVCDTYQFSPRDMRTIFKFLPKVCTHFPIVIHSKEPDLFMLDLKTDTPPYNVKAQVKLGSDLVRYFSPVIVANAIENLIYLGDTWSGILKSINNILFTRVVKTLGLKHTRQYARKKEKYSLLGVIGFEDIIGFLYKINKNTLVDPQQIAQKTAPVSDVRSITPVSHELSLYMESDTGNIMGTKDDYHLHQTLSATHKQAAKQSKNVSETPIKQVSLRQIKVYDSSATGYSLSWNDPSTHGKIGDLIGIISADRKRLEIAIIRRIVLGPEDIIRRIALNIGDDFGNKFGGNFKFGVEVLAFEAELVYLSSLGKHKTGTWAVFIPGNELLDREDSLIYNMGQFMVGENVHIHKGDNVILCLLLKELNSTMTISHVELAYPAANQTVTEETETENEVFSRTI